MVPRPGLPRAHHQRGPLLRLRLSVRPGPRPRPAGLGATRPCGLAGGCPSAFAQLGHSPIGVTAAGPESVPASKHCHSPLSVPPRTFTTEWQCETHCHSTLIVPMQYARRRVAVYGAPLSTLTTEWQCETHCHSPLNVPDALPLAPDRTNAVRSPPSGSEGGTATRP